LTLVPVTELRKEVASPPKACIAFVAVPEAEVLEDAPVVGFGNWREAADGGWTPHVGVSAKEGVVLHIAPTSLADNGESQQ
jgi:hypothetical protein